MSAIRELAKRYVEDQTVTGTLARALLSPDPSDRVAVWRAWCLDCEWVWGQSESRDEAVRNGWAHIAAVHAADEQYGFRVQGIRGE